MVTLKRLEEFDRPDPPTDPRDKKIADLEAQVALLMRLATSQAEQREAEPPEPLEPVESETARQLAYWNAEPRVRTMIPIEDEKERTIARTHGGRYPTRYMVNGVAYDTWKGVQIEVPASIADLIAYCQNPWAYRDGTKPDDQFDANEAYQRLILGDAPR